MNNKWRIIIKGQAYYLFQHILECIANLQIEVKVNKKLSIIYIYIFKSIDLHDRQIVGIIVYGLKKL